jgi:hypothetical protein
MKEEIGYFVVGENAKVDYTKITIGEHFAMITVNFDCNSFVAFFLWLFCGYFRTADGYKKMLNAVESGKKSDVRDFFTGHSDEIKAKIKFPNFVKDLKPITIAGSAKTFGPEKVNEGFNGDLETQINLRKTDIESNLLSTPDSPKHIFALKLTENATLDDKIIISFNKDPMSDEIICTSPNEKNMKLLPRKNGTYLVPSDDGKAYKFSVGDGGKVEECTLYANMEVEAPKGQWRTGADGKKILIPPSKEPTENVSIQINGLSIPPRQSLLQKPFSGNPYDDFNTCSRDIKFDDIVTLLGAGESTISLCAYELNDYGNIPVNSDGGLNRIAIHFTKDDASHVCASIDLKKKERNPPEEVEGGALRSGTYVIPNGMGQYRRVQVGENGRIMNFISFNPISEFKPESDSITLKPIFCSGNGQFKLDANDSPLICTVNSGKITQNDKNSLLRPGYYAVTDSNGKATNQFIVVSKEGTIDHASPEGLRRKDLPGWQMKVNFVSSPNPNSPQLLPWNSATKQLNGGAWPTCFHSLFQGDKLSHVPGDVFAKSVSLDRADFSYVGDGSCRLASIIREEATPGSAGENEPNLLDVNFVKKGNTICVFDKEKDGPMAPGNYVLPCWDDVICGFCYFIKFTVGANGVAVTDIPPPQQPSFKNQANVTMVPKANADFFIPRDGWSESCVQANDAMPPVVQCPSGVPRLAVKVDGGKAKWYNPATNTREALQPGVYFTCHWSDDHPSNRCFCIGENGTIVSSEAYYAKHTNVAQPKQLPQLGTPVANIVECAKSDFSNLRSGNYMLLPSYVADNNCAIISSESIYFFKNEDGNIIAYPDLSGTKLMRTGTYLIPNFPTVGSEKKIYIDSNGQLNIMRRFNSIPIRGSTLNNGFKLAPIISYDSRDSNETYYNDNCQFPYSITGGQYTRNGQLIRDGFYAILNPDGTSIGQYVIIASGKIVPPSPSSSIVLSPTPSLASRPAAPFSASASTKISIAAPPINTNCNNIQYLNIENISARIAGNGRNVQVYKLDESGIVTNNNIINATFMQDDNGNIFATMPPDNNCLLQGRYLISSLNSDGSGFSQIHVDPKGYLVDNRPLPTGNWQYVDQNQTLSNIYITRINNDFSYDNNCKLHCSFAGGEINGLGRNTGMDPGNYVMFDANGDITGHWLYINRITSIQPPAGTVSPATIGPPWTDNPMLADPFNGSWPVFLRYTLPNQPNRESICNKEGVIWVGSEDFMSHIPNGAVSNPIWAQNEGFSGRITFKKNGNIIVVQNESNTALPPGTYHIPLSQYGKYAQIQVGEGGLLIERIKARHPANTPIQGNNWIRRNSFSNEGTPRWICNANANDTYGTNWILVRPEYDATGNLFFVDANTGNKLADGNYVIPECFGNSQGDFRVNIGPDDGRVTD